MQPLRNHHCPLCGEPNACALAVSGDVNRPCWCASIKIDSKVLAQIPEAQRNQACVCAACATPRTLNNRPDP